MILPIAGAAVDDELGFTIGFAAATWIGTVLWWAIFVRALAALGSDACARPPPPARRAR